MMNYSCYNVQFNKHPIEPWVVVKGDISNDSSKNYNTAVFRIKIFIAEEVLGSAIIKVRGLRARSSKGFEVMIEGVHRDLIQKIGRYEILFESAY